MLPARRSTIRRPVLLATAAFVLALPMVAQAEDAAPVAAPASDSAADATASSTDIAGESSLETANGDIVVTARRRRETAQTVPIAIAVIDGARIDNSGSFNVGRLQQITPTLQFASSNPRNSSVNIRGLGAPLGLTNDGIEQGVGVYVDDVYYARVASTSFDFLDVARIEVLRGPQGTLYGKNTTAGAINITTRQPTFDLEGRAEISVGNLGFVQAKGALSGPLSETLAARIAISATRRDGTLYNTATRRWVNAQDNLGVHGQLLWRPSDTLDVTIGADYNRQAPECCTQIFVRTVATQRPLNRQFAALSAAQNYHVPSDNVFDRLTDVDVLLQAENTIGGASIRAVWNRGSGTLTSVTAWRFWDWKPSNDRDFLGLPITTASQNPSQQNQYTQELRYAGRAGPVDYVIGAFGFYQRVRTQGLQQQGAAASAFLLNPASALSRDPAVLGGLTARNAIDFRNLSAALFGQATWHVSDRFSLQPGLRLNYDDKKGSYSSIVTDGSGRLVTFAANDPVTVAQRGVLAPQAFDARYDAWNLSYSLVATFQATSDVLLYASYAHSFKSGGINLNGVPADASGAPILAAATVRPERIAAYEAGIKTQWIDRTLTLNLTGFWTDVSNYQAVVSNGQLGVLRGYLANADRVRSRGVEWEARWQPSRRFQAYATGAWTDATYVRFKDAPCPPGLSGGTAAGAGQTPSAPGTPGGLSPAACDVSGQWLPGISPVAGSWGAEYAHPVTLFGHQGSLYLGYDGSGRSRYSANASRSAATDIAGYTLHNLRAGYRSEGGVDVYVWVRNATNVHYLDSLSVASGNTGLIVGTPGDPRTYGLTLSGHF